MRLSEKLSENFDDETNDPNRIRPGPDRVANLSVATGFPLVS